jgi:signal transduction histidine kinase
MLTTIVGIMILPEKPHNESERLKALKSYEVLDTLSEREYDQLTAIASQICGCKMSLISLIDEDRQWFKARVGLDVSETAREFAFCAHAINEPRKTLVVPDARLDSRFHDNPLVTGNPHLAFYAGVPLVNEDGLSLGTLCVLDSEPKNLTESQLNSLNALADQVMALLELRRSKMALEKTLGDLEEKNRELEQFAFIAAHDLKSPLNGISSLTDVLIDSHSEALHQDGVRMLNAIRGSSQQLSSLITGLLDYYRLDGASNDEVSPIQREELVSQITNLFGGDADVEFQFSIQPPVINTHGPVLLQVLLNLVSNSIKYNDKPNTIVKIQIDDEMDGYHVVVADNGPGINSLFHDKLFELFETAASSDRYGKRGNGIGLATVKKLVNRIGGAISFSSEIGKGTIFEFTMPR